VREFDVAETKVGDFIDHLFATGVAGVVPACGKGDHGS
jgi:hypothetical protein